MIDVEIKSMPCPGIWLGEEYSGCRAATEKDAPGDCPTCNGDGRILCLCADTERVVKNRFKRH